MSRTERASVGTLPMIAPAHADGDRAVFIVLRPAFRRVRAVKAAAVDADSHTRAALHGIRGIRRGLFLRRLELGAHDIDHVRQAEHFGGLTGRIGIAGLVTVDRTQFQRIHAELFGQLVNEHFGGEFAFRSTVATERSPPAVVRADRFADTTDIFDAVSSTDVLGTAQGQQVAEFGIRAMVDDPVGFHRLDFAGGLIGGVPDGRKERRALAGVLLLLFIVVAQMAGTACGEHGHADKRFHRRAELVAEGTPRVALHHDHVVGEIKPQTGGDHQAVQVQADGF